MMHHHPPGNLTQKHQTEKEKSLNAIQCNHFTAGLVNKTIPAITKNK
jgi:hypothetical protein